MTWTQTTRGKKLDLLNPKPGDVSIPEIAIALGNQCRYAGCIKKFYSVAEHSVLISDWLRGQRASPDLQLAGLLHDAAEAYTGDLTWPMQAVLWGAAPTAGEAYKLAQERLEELICTEAEIDPHNLHRSAVKLADLRILLDEREALLGPAVEPWYPETIGLGPLGVPVVGLLPDVASAAWWQRFVDLQEQRGIEVPR